MPTTSIHQLANPFVGLRAFEENEDYLFFGRGTQIGELLTILGQSRFLAVIGSSGSGKSSLVKSGLLPAIYSGFMTLGSNWRAVSMRPGEDPLGYLTKALATDGVLYSDAGASEIPYEWIIESSLRRSENGLVQTYKDARLPPNENLLIVVDQFEELFRFSKYEKENRRGKSDAIHFIQILLTAVQQKEVPVYVLLTMRADFLGDCAEFRGLPEAINEGQFLIPRMKRDEIREAITGPVAVSGATISPRLVTRLLNDLNNDTDQLPILQHALMRTWDAWYHRGQHSTAIDFEDYEKIGTMKKALSLHADEAYAELQHSGEQTVCELMFKALTDKAADIRGIRRPRSVADLCELSMGSEVQVKHVVEVFRKPGRTFLMPPPSVPLTENSIIDISHESLMRVWKRLVKWIEEEARSGDVYLRLANSAKLHERGERSLLKNPELEIALAWREKNKPSEKWAEGYKADFNQAMLYLDKSREEDLAEKEAEQKRAKRERTRLISFLFFLTAAAIALGLFGIAAKRSATQAEKAERRAVDSASAAKVARIMAERNLQSANEARQAATDSAASAEVARNEAEVSKAKAITALGIAQKSESKAKEEKDRAEKAQQDAESARKEIADNHKKALLSISREYARLIREGPSDENGNKNAFYSNNYFLSYTHHFNNLEDSIALSRDGVIPDRDKKAYQVLKEKLYYNNDLYKRIFENLEKINEQNKAIEQVDNSTGSSGRGISPASRGLVFQQTGGLQNEISFTNGAKAFTYALAKRGQEFIAATVSEKDRLVFGSTNDNFIYVFNDRMEKVDSIAMGAPVTALDFFNNGAESIIYFGTASGYIGYIVYDRRKRNQPVFENKLDTRISAIQLFDRCRQAGEKSHERFLLVTGIGSSPRVYKLDEQLLKPDKLLLGNELPYNKRVYGEITGARYDCDQKRVRLYTKGNGTFLWNPFADELLEFLNAKRPLNDQLLRSLKLY